MRRQTLLVACGMLDRMRPRQQLGEEQDSNEKDLAKFIHNNGSVYLDKQTFEIFTFRKVQCNRMI